jgi:hypothetical protein
MIAKRIALLVVVVAALAIVAVKARSRGNVAPTTGAVAGRVAVVMVADAREADSDCGCGEIIRRVRAAKARGVAVREVAPDDAEAARRYGVTVAPTVVFLGADSGIIARREGESPETVAAIAADLSRLEETRR